MVNDERIRIYHPIAKIYLDYEVRILRELLDIIRNEAGSSSTPLLLEYESKLITSERLGQIREAERQQEILDQRIEGDVE